MKNNKKRLFVTIIIFLFTLCIAPITAFAATEISKVEFSMTDYYNAGEKPMATAQGYGDTKDYYDVDYEYWLENGTNKWWKSNKSENELTTFEDGKTYSYGIYLNAKEGYTFADNVEVYVNGEKVSRTLSDDKKTMMLLAIKKITPTVYQEKYIEEVEINNATISFKVGDKPVFTGKVSDDVPYALRDESWIMDGDNKENHSGSMWNDNNPDKLFNTFDNGKRYTYGIYFVSYDYKGYFFTRNTKLKINGKYYNYHESEWESQPGVNKFSTMWITTDLIMTPTSSGQPIKETTKEIKSTGAIKGSITFEKEVSKNYTLDIKQVEASKKLSDNSVKYLVDINVFENGQVISISNTKMKIKIALPESLKGYNKYEVVYILNDEIKETIPAKIENGYIVFETTHLSKYGIIAKNTTVKNPDTADNILVSFATLFISVVGMSSCFILKKRFN